jgi:hypothetical protein
LAKNRGLISSVKEVIDEMLAKGYYIENNLVKKMRARFAFQYTKTNQTQIVLYWYETATFTANNKVQQKHVKISIIAYPKTTEEIPAIEGQMLKVAEVIASYWQPIKAWTQISLTISGNGLALTIASFTLLATTLVYQKLHRWKERKTTLKLYKKLNQQEIEPIIKAIQQASKKVEPTTNEIAAYYQKITGRKIKTEVLSEKLRQTQKIGLIEKEITSKDDEPIAVWKSNMSFKNGVDTSK